MKYYCLLLLSFLLFAACDNVSYAPLIGKWQLKTVEKNGEVMPVDTVWYNFQSLSVFSLQIYKPQQDCYLECYGVQTQDEKLMTVKILLDLDEVIKQSDWRNTERKFTIEHLNRKRLSLLSEEGYLYSFIKF